MTTYEAPTRTHRNILVVDDVRTMKFAATTKRTLDAGIEALLSQPWDEVWLDHDLDFGAYDVEQANDWYQTGRDTTRPLARLAAQRGMDGEPLPVKMFVIHSGNPAGKQVLAAILLPHYTVGLASAHQWTKREQYPSWANNFLNED